MIQLSELQTMRDALQRAMFSGTRRVQFTDRAVEYNSIDDMRKAITDIDTAIAVASGSETASSSFSLAVHSRE
jgi:hypothetical protein